MRFSRCLRERLWREKGVGDKSMESVWDSQRFSERNSPL
ncbi:hypothetical protein COLO4_08525 [Corchorus olitorius]|uniref:Uncharacterized protein n=1 Tax=Corchorus olitorius TaxID=93759 RepID=A0A1R3KFH0_9ROSI|nr:hypothetical protein COLO4_08525 [Corchorus olitorius]